MILSPGPLIHKLRTLLKDYTEDDYLLLSGDPAIIGVVCSVVSDITNGKFKLLKWDRQEKNLLSNRNKYSSKVVDNKNYFSIY